MDHCAVGELGSYGLSCLPGAAQDTGKSVLPKLGCVYSFGQVLRGCLKFFYSFRVLSLKIHGKSCSQRIPCHSEHMEFQHLGRCAWLVWAFHTPTPSQQERRESYACGDQGSNAALRSLSDFGNLLNASPRASSSVR
jgi:hypothetical protein